MATKVKSFKWNDGSGDLLSCELLTGKGNGEIIASSPLNEYLDREQELIVSGLVMDNFNSFEVDDGTITLTENTICVPNFGVKSTVALKKRIFGFYTEWYEGYFERVMPGFRIRVSGLYEGESLNVSIQFGDLMSLPRTLVNGDTDIPSYTLSRPPSYNFRKHLTVTYEELLDERPSTPVYITILPIPCSITVSQEGAREIFSASDGEFIPSEENLFITLKS